MPSNEKKWFIHLLNETSISERRFLKLGQNTVGRSRNNDIQLHSRFSSRIHARIHIEENHAMIQTATDNPLFVNNNRINTADYLLHHNDIIIFGIAPNVLDGIEERHWKHFDFIQIKNIDYLPLMADIDLTVASTQENQITYGSGSIEIILINLINENHNENGNPLEDDDNIFNID